MTTDLDLERLPYEVERALDRECILLDTLRPGLAVRPEPDEVLILEGLDATEPLARIPRYRLAEPDPDRLRKRVADAVREHFPTARADQLLAALAAGAVQVATPPDRDYVIVTVEHIVLALHRGLLVDGWPTEDG